MLDEDGGSIGRERGLRMLMASVRVKELLGER